MKVMLSLSLVLTLATTPVLAECVAPLNDVKIPNGNKATLEEMVAANHEIQENTTEVEVYWQCLKEEQAAKVDAIGPDITDDQKSKIASEYATRHQAEVDKLQTLADRFDAAERSFRSKQAAAQSAEEDAEETAAVDAAQGDAAEKARHDAAALKADEAADKPAEYKTAPPAPKACAKSSEPRPPSTTPDVAVAGTGTPHTPPCT